jgi:F-type H+-transporting ATPase subunit a
MINIRIQPEYIAEVAGFKLTNSLMTSFLVTALLCLVSIYFYFSRKGKENILIKVLSVLIFELLQLTDSVTQDRTLSKKIIPLIATIFIFIVTANLLGMIPGFLGAFYVRSSSGQVPLLRSPNSDLNITLALAIVSVSFIQYFSIKYLGLAGYISRFINFTNPIKLITGFFEMLSEGIKILSFSFRLFGNIFAGEVLLLIVAFLVPFILPLPFMILEVFVGVIQAFIFAMLTLTFIKSSTVRFVSPNEALHGQKIE